MLSCFNLTFTSLPILSYGIFEKRYEMRKLYNDPKLYANLLRNNDMRLIIILKYFILGILKLVILKYNIALSQASFAFYFIYIAYNGGSINNSQLVVFNKH